jgi:hypothetical protein
MKTIPMLVVAAALLLMACEPKPGQPPTPKTEVPAAGMQGSPE